MNDETIEKLSFVRSSKHRENKNYILFS